MLRRGRLTMPRCGPVFGTLLSAAWSKLPMDITSPFVVVPVIIGVFIISILFSTSSKEDNGHSH
jgi:hypothetical protein